jgi:hypothetical protein
MPLRKDAQFHSIAPNRDYFLYRGPAFALLGLTER